MEVPERFDFFIASMTFGIVIGQIFVPYGYPASIAGVLGSVLLFVWPGTSLLAMPIFDRMFTHHLTLVLNILILIMRALWLVFAFAVRVNNMGGLFALMAFICTFSVPTLPIALELSCELTRNPDGASAPLYSL